MAARAFSDLFEIALVLVRFNHVASRISVASSFRLPCGITGQPKRATGLLA